jgi:hypothetical protein
MPADRDGVRRFLSRFADRQVEVALEAATGWRFVGEEIRAIGARAHLAEPAEASALKGNKKRAKTDRADARQVLAPVRDDAQAREAGAVDLPETSLGDPPIRRDR